MGRNKRWMRSSDHGNGSGCTSTTASQHSCGRNERQQQSTSVSSWADSFGAVVSRVMEGSSPISSAGAARPQVQFEAWLKFDGAHLKNLCSVIVSLLTEEPLNTRTDLVVSKYCVWKFLWQITLRTPHTTPTNHKKPCIVGWNGRTYGCFFAAAQTRELILHVSECSCAQQKKRMLSSSLAPSPCAMTLHLANQSICSQRQFEMSLAPCGFS